MKVCTGSQSDYRKMHNLFRPVLKELEDRCVPATYLWEPGLNAQGIPVNPVWSAPSNWDVKNKSGDWEYQAVATPGSNDTVVFDGNPPGWVTGSSSANNNCYVDVGGGVTVSNVEIQNGYSKILVLSNPLTVSGGFLHMYSQSATISGASLYDQSQRGILNITQDAIFGFAAGSMSNLTVNTAANANMIVDDPLTMGRFVTNSDIFINNTCQLIWRSGNVSVINRSNNSHITIASGGVFEISAVGFTWGMSTPPTPPTPAYFGVHNAGLVKSTGYAIILGNYDTTGATRLYSGILWIDGKAEQTAGVFELRNDAIIKVDGAESALRIYDGVIAGQGAVAANLTLGYDPAIYAGMPPTAAMITPGILPIVPYARTVGTLTVTAAFQIFSGSMVIDVNAVGEFDQIVVHGNYAALAGSLFVQYDTDYKPPQQTTLPFLTFQSLIGDFSSRTWNNYAWQCPGSTIPFSWFFSTTATSYNLFSRQQMDHGKY